MSSTLAHVSCSKNYHADPRAGPSTLTTITRAAVVITVVIFTTDAVEVATLALLRTSAERLSLNGRGTELLRIRPQQRALFLSSALRANAAPSSTAQSSRTPHAQSSHARPVRPGSRRRRAGDRLNGFSACRRRPRAGTLPA